MTQLSRNNVDKLRAIVERRGLAAVARVLGVPRSSLGSVLVGRGRLCTNSAIADAYLRKAAELEGL